MTARHLSLFFILALMVAIAPVSARHGAILHTAAFGVARPDGRSMTTDAPLLINSTGKSITALAMQHLYGRGRLTWILPDIAAMLLVIALVLLAVGATRLQRQRRRA